VNIADLALLIIWGFFFFRGYYRGLVKEIASIVALALGFKLAVLYSPKAAPYVNQLVSNPGFAAPAAFILIFAGVMIVCSLVVTLLTGLMRFGLMDWANRFFGGFFGLAKGILLTAVLLWIWFAVSPPPRPEFMDSSKLVPVLEKVNASISRFIPPGWEQELKSLTSHGTPKKAAQEPERPQAKPALPPEKGRKPNQSNT